MSRTEEHPPGGAAAPGFAALAVVLLSALALGANRPVSWLMLAILLLGLLAWQGLAGAAPPRPGAPKGPPRLPALLYLGVLAWGLVQAVPGLVPADWAHPAWAGLGIVDLAPAGGPTISADPIEGFHRLARLAAYGAAFWLVAAAALDRARAATMLRAIALFSTALAVYGLFTRSAGVNPILGEDLTRGDVLRASFVNRNHYATYAGFGVIANLAVLAAGFEAGSGGGGARRVERLRALITGFFASGWVFALGALLCLGALALTQSRGGAISATAGLLVFLLAHRRHRGAGGRALALSALGLFAFVALTLSSGLFERVLATSKEAKRFVVYPEVWAQSLERPWVGHGLGAFHEVFRSRVPAEAAVGEWDFAHSAYLENIHALGLPAAGAFYLALALVLWRIWRGTAERRRDRHLPAAALGVAAVAGLHSLLDFSLQIPACGALFAAILGLGWAQSFPTRHTGEAPE